MTVKELIEALKDASNQEAEIVVQHDESDQTGLVKPEVTWWSDDKTQFYLGYL